MGAGLEGVSAMEFILVLGIIYERVLSGTLLENFKRMLQHLGQGWPICGTVVTVTHLKGDSLD